MGSDRIGAILLDQEKRRLRKEAGKLTPEEKEADRKKTERSNRFNMTPS